MDLKKLFKPKEKDWKLEDGHKIHKAFVDQGIQHYYIKDVFDTFAHRALDALDVYEKWNMRCSRAYLELMYKANKAIYSNPSTIDITEAIIINNHLGERLSWALPTEDIIWQFAAVVFFDETESPYKYNPEYGKEKIARWKKNSDVTDFFFAIPIKELVTCPDFSKEDFRNYLKTTQELNQRHTKHLSSVLSSRGLKVDSSLASN